MVTFQCQLACQHIHHQLSTRYNSHAGHDLLSIPTSLISTILYAMSLISLSPESPANLFEYTNLFWAASFLLPSSGSESEHLSMLTCSLGGNLATIFGDAIEDVVESPTSDLVLCVGI